MKLFDSELALKINLYLLSLSCLFILLLLKCFPWHEEFPTSLPFDNNILFYVFLGLCFFSLFIPYCVFKKRITSVYFPSYSVKCAENVNYEYMTFFATYIIPLTGIDFTEKSGVLMFFVLIFMMGVIFIRTNMFYSNPVLSIFGYKLYKLSISNIDNNIIAITRDYIDVDDCVEWLKLSKDIWYVKKVR